MAEFEYRGKYNKKLAENYGSFELEKRVKDDAASARRTASLLSNAAKRFVYSVSPEQLLSLRAACSSMNALALELEQLKGWAKALSAFEKAESARLENERLQKYAEKRWGQDDDAMFEEVSDLLACAQSSSGSEVWLREHAQQKCDEIVSAFWTFSNSSLHELQKAVDDSTTCPDGRQKLRHIAASCFYGYSERGSIYRGQSVSFHGGLDNFQVWRKQNREAHSLTALAVSTASGQP